MGARAFSQMTCYRKWRKGPQVNSWGGHQENHLFRQALHHHCKPRQFCIATSPSSVGRQLSILCKKAAKAAMTHQRNCPCEAAAVSIHLAVGVSYARGSIEWSYKMPEQALYHWRGLLQLLHTFLPSPNHDWEPAKLPSYGLESLNTLALQNERARCCRMTMEIVSNSIPVFYSRLFLSRKHPESESSHQLIPCQQLVMVMKFKLETVASVLASIKKVDAMSSIDLKGSYFQILIHMESRPYLQIALTLKGWEFRIRNKTTYTGNGGSSVYGTKPKRRRKMM